MNVCNFIGRIGKDAETRFTQGGKPVTSWSLAVDSGYGDTKQTLWIDCSLWGERGEKIAEYLTKGAQIGVTGELGTREHEGKTYLKLRVADVTLCGGKRDKDEPPQRQRRQEPRAAPAGHDFDSDDIPFAPRSKREYW